MELMYPVYLGILNCKLWFILSFNLIANIAKMKQKQTDSDAFTSIGNYECFIHSHYFKVLNINANIESYGI